MLPVAALDVRAGHAVLDLCSAPGSKTCQLLDGLQSRGNGLLVANDVLAERSERVGSRAKCQDCRELMVTTTDGVWFGFQGVSDRYAYARLQLIITTYYIIL